MKASAKVTIAALARPLLIFCASLAVFATEAVGQEQQKAWPPGSAMKESPQTPSHEFVLRGAAALKIGEVEEAERFLGKAAEIDKMNGEALKLLGKVNFLKKRYDLAEQYLLRASKLLPNNVSVHLLLGKVKLAQKKKTEAFEHFQEVSELEPQNAEAKLLLGYLGNDMGVKKPRSADLAEIAYSAALTRGEFAKLIVSEVPQVRSYERGASAAILSDVAGTGMAQAIREVVERSIMAPYANSTFAPYAPLKRGEMALAIEAVLARAGVKIEELRPVAAPTGDYRADEFNVYYGAVVLLSSLGIIETPKRPGKASISGEVSGQEAISALARLSQYLTLRG